MKSLSEPPTVEEIQHLLGVVTTTCGPANEVTRILERLIQQRDMAVDVCKRLTEFKAGILHKQFDHNSPSLKDLFRCAEECSHKTPTLP